MWTGEKKLQSLPKWPSGGSHLGDNICGVFIYLMYLLNPFSTPFSWSCWLCLSPDLKHKPRRGMSCTLRCLALSQRNEQVFRHELFAQPSPSLVLPLASHCTWSYGLHVSPNPNSNPRHGLNLGPRLPNMAQK